MSGVAMHAHSPNICVSKPCFLSVDYDEAGQVSLFINKKKVGYPDHIREDLSKIFPYLDSKKSYNEIASLTQTPLDRVLFLLQNFFENGLLLSHPNEPIHQMSFASHLVNYGKIQASFYKGSFLNLEGQEKEFLKDLFLRFQINSYFFILGSRRHIAQAILSSRDSVTQKFFCQYLSEEYWHSDLIKQALLRSGMNQQDIQKCCPSKETEEFLEYIELLAREDLEAYVICLGVLEGHSYGEDALKNLHKKWDRIKNMGLFPDSVMDIHMQHEGFDLMANHSDLYEKILKDDEVFTPIRQKDLYEKIETLLKKQERAYSVILNE